MSRDLSEIDEYLQNIRFIKDILVDNGFSFEEDFKEGAKAHQFHLIGNYEHFQEPTKITFELKSFSNGPSEIDISLDNETFISGLPTKRWGENDYLTLNSVVRVLLFKIKDMYEV